MNFIDIVSEVVDLARERAEEEADLIGRHGLQDRVMLASAGADAFMTESRPKAQALEDYIESLNDATVLKLQAVMYAGRDNNPNLRDLKKQLNDDRKDAVRSMLEKTPLGDYLADGLVLACENFVDLEGDL